jgi:small subunit ribosomal protein S14
MAKKNMLEREFKRKRMVLKYLEKRNKIKKELRLLKLNHLKGNSDFLNISNVLKKFQKLPRNSSPTRLRNRCWKTGKPHGFFRHFGLCRNAFRELANNGMLPGVIKSSW